MLGITMRRPFGALTVAGIDRALARAGLSDAQAVTMLGQSSPVAAGLETLGLLVRRSQG